MGTGQLKAMMTPVFCSSGSSIASKDGMFKNQNESDTCRQEADRGLMKANNVRSFARAVRPKFKASPGCC